MTCQECSSVCVLVHGMESCSSVLIYFQSTQCFLFDPNWRQRGVPFVTAIGTRSDKAPTQSTIAASANFLSNPFGEQVVQRSEIEPEVSIASLSCFHNTVHLCVVLDVVNVVLDAVVCVVRVQPSATTHPQQSASFQHFPDLDALCTHLTQLFPYRPMGLPEDQVINTLKLTMYESIQLCKQWIIVAH